MAVRFPAAAAGLGASRARHAPPKGPTLSPGRAGWIVSRKEQAHLLGRRGCPARAAADSRTGGLPVGGGGGHLASSRC